MRRQRTRAASRGVSATTEILAPAVRIFEVLADISRHPDLDGSGTVLGEPIGPSRLSLGAEFTMSMQQLRTRYRSVNRVVEFEEGRRITWETHGVWRGHPVIGGQRWRWTLTPSPKGTVVQHTYLWGHARLPLLTVWLPRYPARARRTLPGSLSRLNTILSTVEPTATREQRPTGRDPDHRDQT